MSISNCTEPQTFTDSIFDSIGFIGGLVFTICNIPQIVKISANHANGFMNLTNDSSIIVFSDKTLEESLDDDIRYPYDKWDIWKIEHF